MKQRYVPVDRRQVPKEVRDMAKEDKWQLWNLDRWVRLAHKDNESGVVFEFAAVYGRRLNSALKQWFVADGTRPAPDRGMLGR